MDRSTITQHLLNDATDPFNRKPLKVAMLEPQSTPPLLVVVKGGNPYVTRHLYR